MKLHVALVWIPGLGAAELGAVPLEEVALNQCGGDRYSETDERGGQDSKGGEAVVRISPGGQQ